MSSSYNFQIIHLESKATTEATTISAAVGGAIGSILTLIVIVAIIAVFILYRRRTNRDKKNGDSNDDGQHINTNVNVDKEVAISEVSPYQANRNTDDASTLHDNDINANEGHDETQQDSGANALTNIQLKKIRFRRNV